MNAWTTDADALMLLLIAVSLPFGLDPFTNIINVHWDDGLAVEFFDGAGPPVPVGKNAVPRM